MARDFGDGGQISWDVLYYPVNSFIFNIAMSFIQNGLLLNALLFLIWPEWFLEDDLADINVADLNTPRPGYPAMVVQLYNLALQLLFNEDAIFERLPFGINNW
eukprot:CAMPEP_0170503694 /NCGR_PEP_ID=MMETSP0208-20121228/45621_1 /TAXON_ID=197538 /ORGANISM="Strombidium inclinatum, Strain S3" /LENGTH=102 /DNA_ID=CAMNT_0010783477 /DNA_START=120 /DNA_END=425 /DNA_ORIENTATION=+